MKKWLRWAFYYEDGSHKYGMWNVPDDVKARICQAKQGIERVEIHAKMIEEDQRTEVMASLNGVQYKKIMFDMKQVFSPIYGTTSPVLIGMRLVNNEDEQIKVMGV
jgi:hypothetical protein